MQNLTKMVNTKTLYKEELHSKIKPLPNNNKKNFNQENVVLKYLLRFYKTCIKIMGI